MRPDGLRTKIFLDSGNPADTKEALHLLGFLDGQTTNPSLVAKHPEIVAARAGGKKYSKEEILALYKEIVTEISDLIPNGSVSIEVDADAASTAEMLFSQGKEFFGWIPNAHIKYPTIAVGLEAAEKSIAERMRVNMTLVFSQQQGAAVYAATCGAARGDVFLSPFIGRLDDIGENGVDFIRNTMKMYANSDHHVEVLAASIRTLDHLLLCFDAGVDIVTVPLNVLKIWQEQGMPIQGGNENTELKKVAYEELDLSAGWQSFTIAHELTDKGLAKFSQDWHSLLQS